MEASNLCVCVCRFLFLCAFGNGCLQVLHLVLREGECLLKDVIMQGGRASEEGLGQERSARVLAIEARKGEGGGVSPDVKDVVDEATWENEKVAGRQGGGEVGVVGVDEAGKQRSGDDEERLGSSRVDVGRQEAVRLVVHTRERQALRVEGRERRARGRRHEHAIDLASCCSWALQNAALEVFCSDRIRVSARLAVDGYGGASGLL